MESDIEQKTDELYKEYYNRKGEERNDLLKNPEVLFQILGYDRAVVSAIASTKLNPKTAKVLDVGCGDGASMLNLVRLGFLPSNLYGIDIIEERITQAKLKISNINWILGNASCLKFDDNFFECVMESTMFLQMTDDELSDKIAKEMIRVTKKHGYILLILLIDWRYSHPFNKEYKGLSKKRITNLFDVGSKTSIFKIYKGALVPPIGRFISRNIPCIYFTLQKLFPFLVGQVVTVLKKS
ncbi:MAG: methyltransferase domain-containing protein [Desulfobacterales bacterium]|nr:methyltransferase domain-containing protein [Desulfobacterales bacterium]